MPNELIGLLIQIPLVAAFVWFALKMNQNQREATEADQKRWLDHEKILQASTHEFIETQNERWHEILQTEKERRKEAMDQGLKEVDTVGKAISRLADALALQAEAFSRHDASAIERHNNIIDKLRNKE